MDIRRELRQKGIPKMNLRVDLHEDGDLEIGILNCSMTEFTAENHYPGEQKYSVEEIAEDLFQIFLDYVEWDDQPEYEVR